MLPSKASSVKLLGVATAGARAWTLVRAIFGIDLRTLALFRVMLGAIIIADLALRARDLSAHYSDRGVLTRAALLADLGSWAPSLHLMSGAPLVQALLFVIAGLVALAMLIGYRTRAATIASWILPAHRMASVLSS